MSAETIIEEVLPVLTRVIPALAPYSGPIGLAFEAVATIAPPVYNEIKALVAQIAGGGEPSPEQVASLRGLIANLKRPDAYFGGPDPTPNDAELQTIATALAPHIAAHLAPLLAPPASTVAVSGVSSAPAPAPAPAAPPAAALLDAAMVRPPEPPAPAVTGPGVTSPASDTLTGLE